MVAFDYYWLYFVRDLWLNPSFAFNGLLIFIFLILTTQQSTDDMEALEKIQQVLTQDFQEGASAFEMVHSGLVTQLLKYLTEKGVKGDVPRTTRIKRFLKLFLGLNVSYLISFGTL